MKKTALVAAVLALSWGVAYAEEKCPISGKPAKDDISLEVNGKKVSFCCNACPDAYKKKIGLVDEGPKTCPISGEKASKSVSVIERTAETVNFCCEKCPKTFAEKNKFEVKDAGPKTCPVSGAPAKDAPGTSLVVNGEKLYFCCASCPKKFQKELGVAEKGVTKCPISGAPGKAEHAMIVVKSKVVYFCCENCKEKYCAKTYKDGVVIAPPPGAEKGEKKGEEHKKNG